MVTRPDQPPVYSACVIGYREWKLNDWVLTPVSVGPPWRAGVNHATCRLNESPFGKVVDPDPAPHGAPGAACVCGFYAMHALPAPTTHPYVLGAIAAWGNLEVHHDGFRAEYAQIVALAEPTDIPAELRDGFDLAAKSYGVPVVRYSDLPSEAARHGSSLPPSARPPALTREITSLIPWWFTAWFSTPAPAPRPPARPLPPHATWSLRRQDELDEAIELGQPGDGQISAAITNPPRVSRQGPPRPRRAPRDLGRPGR